MFNLKFRPDILFLLHRFEDGLLVVLLGTMIALASTQIALRNLFDYGLVWIDPLLRVMVLWLGLIGASVATRENRHIQIDLLTRFLDEKSLLLLNIIINQFSAWVCLIIAWYGAAWIRFDFVDEIPSFIGIPAWMLEIVIPIAFTIIGIRYLVQSFRQGALFYNRFAVPTDRNR
ncbi:MAG: TRAP transporter small permease [Gammaproteobacteria bacterium]